MSLETLTEGLRDRVGTESDLNATVKFDLGDDGVIFVDAATIPSSVTNEDKEADCTVRMTMADFESIVSGDLDAMTAFMMGRLKVDGDMGIAMKLREVL